jgi:MFS transporter, PPP family, 3-phenylpropionic acid transporter
MVDRFEVKPAVAIQGLFVLFGMAIASFYPFFAPFLSGRGLSESEIGLVIAVTALARVLSMPVWGHVADARLGMRRVLQLGMAGAVASSLLLFWFGHGVPAIVAASVAFCLTSSAIGPNIDALALAHLGDGQMHDYGRIRGWESLSYAGWCLLLGFSLQHAGLDRMLPVFAAAGVAVLAWSFTVTPDRPAHVERHGRLGAVGAVFRQAPRFTRFLAGTLLVWVGFSAAWNFISLKILDEGGGPLLVGFAAGLGGLTEVPVMRLSSRMSRSVGLRVLYVGGCLVYATGFLLRGLITDPTVVSFLSILEGAGFGLLFTSSVVIVGRLVPPTLYSTGQAVASTVSFGIAPMLGGAIGGVVFQRLGPAALYIGASLLALAGGLLGWSALDEPAFTRPHPIEEPVAPPPGPEPV